MSSFTENGVGSLIRRRERSSEDEKLLWWQKSLLLWAVMECSVYRVKWRLPRAFRENQSSNRVLCCSSSDFLSEPVDPRDGACTGWKQCKNVCSSPEETKLRVIPDCSLIWISLAEHCYSALPILHHGPYRLPGELSGLKTFQTFLNTTFLKRLVS